MLGLQDSPPLVAIPVLRSLLEESQRRTCLLEAMQKSKVNSSLMPATNGRTLTLHVISLPCLPNQVIPRRHTDRGKTETKSHLTVLIWNYNLSNSTIAGPDKSLLRTDQSTLQAAYKMRIKWCLLKSGHQTNQRTSLALAPASSMAPLCSRTQQHEKRRC